MRSGCESGALPQTVRPKTASSDYSTRLPCAPEASTLDIPARSFNLSASRCLSSRNECIEGERSVNPGIEALSLATYAKLCAPLSLGVEGVSTAKRKVQPAKLRHGTDGNGWDAGTRNASSSD